MSSNTSAKDKHATKAALLGAIMEQVDVDLPSGARVRVRGLSRLESAAVPKGDDVESVDVEAFLVSTGLVEPVLTEDEAREWFAVASAGELEPLLFAIGGLSGTLPESAKARWKAFRDQS